MRRPAWLALGGREEGRATAKSPGSWPCAAGWWPAPVAYSLAENCASTRARERWTHARTRKGSEERSFLWAAGSRSQSWAVIAPARTCSGLSAGGTSPKLFLARFWLARADSDCCCRMKPIWPPLPDLDIGAEMGGTGGGPLGGSAGAICILLQNRSEKYYGCNRYYLITINLGLRILEVAKNCRYARKTPIWGSNCSLTN